MVVLVSHKTMQLNNGLFFFKGESSSLDIGSQVICPSEAATLATPLQACNLTNMLILIAQHLRYSIKNVINYSYMG